MNTSIWEKIAGIPWWAYVVFAYIAYVQCLSLKSRTLEMYEAAFPILGIISIATGVLAFQLSTNPHLISTQMNLYLLSMVCTGLLFGFIQVKMLKIQFISVTKEILIPGSMINFLLGITSIALVIFLKQYIGTEWFISPFVSILSCAFITGLAGGRLIALSALTRLA